MAASIIPSSRGSIQPEYAYKKQKEANTTYVVGVNISPKDGKPFQAEYQVKHVHTDGGMFWRVSNHSEAKAAKVEAKGENISSNYDVSESNSSPVMKFFKGLINKLKVWASDFRDDFVGVGIEDTDNWSRKIQNFYRDNPSEIEAMKNLVAVEPKSKFGYLVVGDHSAVLDRIQEPVKCEEWATIEE